MSDWGDSRLWSWRPVALLYGGIALAIATGLAGPALGLPKVAMQIALLLMVGLAMAGGALGRHEAALHRALAADPFAVPPGKPVPQPLGPLAWRFLPAIAGVPLAAVYFWLLHGEGLLVAVMFAPMLAFVAYWVLWGHRRLAGGPPGIPLAGAAAPRPTFQVPPAVVAHPSGAPRSAAAARVPRWAVVAAAVVAGALLALVQTGGLSWADGASDHVEGAGTRVWMPLGNATLPATLQGAGLLAPVAPPAEAVTDSTPAPAGTQRIELRLGGAGDGTSPTLEVRGRSAWAAASMTGGGDGVWHTEGAFGGKDVRGRRWQHAEAEPRTVEVRLAFQQPGQVWCERVGDREPECGAPQPA